MPDLPPTRRAFGLTFRSTLTAALATALLDLAITVQRSPDPVPGFAWVRALEAALGLYGLLGIALGLAAGLVFGGLWATVDVGAALGAWRRRLADPEIDRAWAAGLLALGAALGVEGAGVLVYALKLGQEMANKRNGALTTAMAAVAIIPVAALAWFPLYRAARRLTPLVPRPRTFVILGALAGLVGLGLAGALLSVDWRVINFGPAEALAIFAALALAFAWLGDKLGRSRLLTGRARGLLTAGLVLVPALAFAVTWLRFGDEARSLQLIAEQSMGARPLFLVARAFADRDHDGFAGRLGGGDCNDRDPAVHPGADDQPGNRVDEDCDGADAEPEVAAPRAPEKPASAAATAFKFQGNLLVITIDTLRADRVNERTMPNLARLARDSVRFTHAYAQAPNTPRSFPSFLTSRFPSEVKWIRMNMNFPPMADAKDNTTFFEALGQAGLHTVGVFSHFYLKREYGIARGFDAWSNDGALNLKDSNTDVAAPRITARVIAQLKALKAQAAAGKPFVLWTHFFEPHSKYMDHDQFPVRSSGMKAVEDRYDGEVSFVDLHVGQILRALEESGLAESTTVVVFSDHGEAFGEHRFGGERMYFHGQTIYDELLRVPLVVHVPGVQPRTVDEPVMLIDLGPTLCDLVKAPRPESFHGRSLLPALLGEPLTPRPVYAELLPTPSWNHLWRAIIDRDVKLIHKISEGTVELYDLGKDPTEQHDLAPTDAALKARLQRLLSGYLRRETRG